jgi:rubrerythrin
VELEWECTECGCFFQGERPPEHCPDCGATDTWEEVEYAEEWDDEGDTSGEEGLAEPDWECLKCGCGFDGNEPPPKCPDCGEVGAWAKVEYVDDQDAEDAEDELEEPEEVDWECLGCGYGLQGDHPPPRCPDCGAVDKWAKVVYIDEWDDDQAESGEERSAQDESARKGWECAECGFVFEDSNPVHTCPECGAVDAWLEVGFLEGWADEEEDSEADE